MVEEAQRWAEQDKKRREDAEKLNAADATCYAAERLLAEHGAKLAADVRARVESALRDAREALGTRDAALAGERAGALERALQEAGAALYRQAAATTATPGEAAPSGSAPHGRVVDAEYKER
jgi:molecular chaperone DnaK